LRDRLSSYKVPRHIEVVEKSAIPLTPSQKVDRRRLRELLAKSLPDNG
jgi:acyl-CoA synthetase (AMP-forming)/AMP-acid ligase II